MRIPITVKFWSAAAAIGLSFALLPPAAHAAGCQAELNKAEQRWNLLRTRLDLKRDFEEKVTHLLTRAAELRHQAEIKGCLNMIQEAKDEMDHKEARHRVKPKARH